MLKTPIFFGGLQFFVIYYPPELILIISKPLKTDSLAKKEFKKYVYVRQVSSRIPPKAKAHDWPSTIINVRVQDRPYLFIKLRVLGVYTIHAILFSPIRPRCVRQAQGYVNHTAVIWKKEVTPNFEVLEILVSKFSAH